MFIKYFNSLLFSIIIFTPLFSSEINQEFKVIDLGKNYESFSPNESWKLGYYAFNSAPELTPFFALLKRDYHINTVIETGTFEGSSTVLFSILFNKVYTIDNSVDFHQKAKENLKIFSNIQCCLGSSEKVLKSILPFHSSEPVLFYLDAHWESYWPLLDELKEIAVTHKDNCIIVIDDIKVPARDDILYDRYENHECSYEYVKSQLDKVFTEYTIQYLIPRSVGSKAKLVVIPKQWKIKI